jgi:5-methylcytosine-specific restriction endonuclease McrA
VVLTIAHVVDKRPEVANLLNLAALCQRCHLNWDRREHNFNRIRNQMADPESDG